MKIDTETLRRVMEQERYSHTKTIGDFEVFPQWDPYFTALDHVEEMVREFTQRGLMRELHP